jgi:hypothetical protein
MGMFPVYNLISTHYIGGSGTGARFRKSEKKKEKATSRASLAVICAVLTQTPSADRCRTGHHHVQRPSSRTAS